VIFHSKINSFQISDIFAPISPDIEKKSSIKYSKNGKICSKNVIL
jgi:hypothetical protein